MDTSSGLSPQLYKCPRNPVNSTHTAFVQQLDAGGWVSSGRLRRDAARRDRPKQHVIVALGLVGIGLRKGGDGLVKAVVHSKISRDLHRVTGAGVRSRQCPATDVGIHRETGS